MHSVGGSIPRPLFIITSNYLWLVINYFVSYSWGDTTTLHCCPPKSHFDEKIVWNEWNTLPTMVLTIFRIWFFFFSGLIDQLWQFAQEWHNKTYLRSKSKVLYSRNNMIKRGKSETIWNELNFFELFEEEEVEGGRGRDREPLFVVENDDCQLVCKNVSFYNMFENYHHFGVNHILKWISCRRQNIKLHTIDFFSTHLFSC